MSIYLRRREFIAALGGVAAWPLAVRAQRPERMRRIGVLSNGAENDPQWQVQLAAFKQRLTELGWTEGHNLRFDIRWTAGNADVTKRYATELAVLGPVDIHRSQTMPPTRNSMAANDFAVFS